jgi:hypothetical protein
MRASYCGIICCSAGYFDMADRQHFDLINAELDGELDAAQRAELARCLLADPQVRTLREDMRRLGQLLDGMKEVEPPEALRQHVFAALQQTYPRRRSFSTVGWRLAAMLAGVVAAGALVFETTKGPGMSSGELSGTIAAAQTPTMVDTERLGEGPVSGRVSLYHDRAQWALKFEMVTSAPVDVLIASGAHSLRVNGLGGLDKSGASLGSTVPLPGFEMNGEPVDLTFMIGGRKVAQATLRAPAGR